VLAVAIIDEGIELRESGVTAPILLLAEVPADTIAAALENSLTITIARSRAPAPRSRRPKRSADATAFT